MAVDAVSGSCRVAISDRRAAEETHLKPSRFMTRSIKSRKPVNCRSATKGRQLAAHPAKRVKRPRAVLDARAHLREDHRLEARVLGLGGRERLDERVELGRRAEVGRRERGGAASSSACRRASDAADVAVAVDAPISSSSSSSSMRALRGGGLGSYSSPSSSSPLPLPPPSSLLESSVISSTVALPLPFASPTFCFFGLGAFSSSSSSSSSSSESINVSTSRIECVDPGDDVSTFSTV